MSATSEDLIQRRLEEERARLARELGIEEVEREPHARPVEHRFTASQRPHTTREPCCVPGMVTSR